MQFHTQASLDAKEETHGAYEQIRSLPDDAEVGKLHAYQREVTAKIPTPPGAPGILEWKRSASRYSYERGNRDAEFYEITEDQANQIVERIRRIVATGE